MEDKIMTCIQCGNNFVISEREQEWLQANRFNIPKRCRDCRKKKHRDFQDGHNEWHQKRNKRYFRREKMYLEKDS